MFNSLVSFSILRDTWGLDDCIIYLLEKWAPAISVWYNSSYRPLIYHYQYILNRSNNILSIHHVGTSAVFGIHDSKYEFHHNYIIYWVTPELAFSHIACEYGIDIYIYLFNFMFVILSSSTTTFFYSFIAYIHTVIFCLLFVMKVSNNQPKAAPKRSSNLCKLLVQIASQLLQMVQACCASLQSSQAIVWIFQLPLETRLT